MYGPQTGSEPAVQGKRHEVLRGFEETDILPFGGVLEPLRVDAGAQVLATFVPAFPVYPPETSWMREPKTDIAGLILNSAVRGGRIAYLSADLDRRFGRDNLPDHGNILANLVRWSAKDDIPLHVEGAGLIDCHLYHQPGRLVLHLVNLTSACTWRQPVDELIDPRRVRARVAGAAGFLGLFRPCAAALRFAGERLSGRAGLPRGIPHDTRGQAVFGETARIRQVRSERIKRPANLSLYTEHLFYPRVKPAFPRGFCVRAV